MKRVFGAIILVIGTFTVYAFLFSIILRLRLDTDDFASLAVTIIGLGIILGGISLWGWARRRMVFGVISTVIGGMLAITNLGPVLISEMAERLPAGALPGVRRCIVIGALLLAGGIILIISQNKIDKAKKAQAPDATGAPDK